MAGFPKTNLSDFRADMATNTDWESRCSSLGELLSARASESPTRVGYTFLNGDRSVTTLSYAQLDANARRIARQLATSCAAGDRALLLYEPGFEFISALFGCFYAGVVAVPAPAIDGTRLKRVLPRLESMVRDARPRIVLGTEPLASAARSGPGTPLGALPWLSTDTLEAGPNAFEPWRSSADDLAILQYTSGSTSAAKGVMLTWRNLLHNSGQIAKCFEHDRDSVGVSWLPPHHDMGLIGGVLQPLFVGFPVVMMSPVSFVLRPFQWLQAISRFRATTSGGPDFAYRLCVEKITAEQKRELDLSSWKVAFTGAEPVRASTLQSFADAFEQCGFRRSSFYPCYGLAEATLLVTGGFAGGGATVSEAPAAEGKASPQPVVGCGNAQAGQRVEIVDPTTRVALPDGRVGEIWCSSPSVAAGYFDQPELSRETFAASLRDEPGQAFLRTGDLGFLRQGELFVTGRSKEVIIVRGRNHYPADLEETVATLHDDHPEIRWQGIAAVGLTIQIPHDDEQVCIVLELLGSKRTTPFEQLARAIAARIAEVHALEVQSVLSVRPGSLPRTTSGKLQRRQLAESIATKQLQVTETWSRVSRRPATVSAASARARSYGEARDFLIDYAASKTGQGRSRIDTRAPFTSFGLDSMAAVTLAAEAGSWAGRSLSPTALWEHPNIDALAAHLSAEETPVAVLETASANLREPIAVLGMACRLPGNVNDPSALWSSLSSGRDLIAAVPRGRPNGAALAAVGAQGGFLEDVELFAARFFGITPREANAMDPQQRLLLEVCWQALENAALAPSSLSGSLSGVFVGVSNSDYARLHAASSHPLDAHAGTGAALSLVANRVSYTLDLRGPSVAVDTACSSSLVAVSQACRSLQFGECDLALAAGVNLILSGELTAIFQEARMLAADFRCKAFDATADGYVRSEGCGVVVLKRLSDAQRDGDPILAVIRGSAVNHDGRSNGITAPNGSAQQAVIRAALRDAGVQPSQVSYVEAHGTGTPLGDPIEASALRAVLAPGRPASDPCLIGTAKTNFGHLESAAGILGLMKTVLALEHSVIPGQLHLSALNPKIDPGTVLRFSARPLPWPERAGGRLAGVSSFGFGGTNAHVVLAQAPKAATRPRPRSASLLLLSAEDEATLHTLAGQYASWLTSDPAVDLNNACVTASVGRSHLRERAAICACDASEAATALTALATGQSASAVQRGSVANAHQPAVLFFLSGSPLGPAALHQLSESEPSFLSAFERCRQAWAAWLSGPEASLSRVGLSEDSPQVLAFAAECALCQLLDTWGIRPAAVLATSSGLYAAGYATGELSLTEAISRAARGDIWSPPAGSRVCPVPSTQPLEGTPLEGAPVVVIGDLGAAAQLTEANNQRLVLLADPDQAVASLVRCVGGLYTVGVSISWPAFHQGAPRLPCSLPNYPLPRERYWLAAEQPLRPEASQAFVLEWRRVAGAAAAPDSRPWLVLTQSEPAAALASALEERGAHVVRLLPRAEFQRALPNTRPIPLTDAGWAEALAEFREGVAGVVQVFAPATFEAAHCEVPAALSALLRTLQGVQRASLATRVSVVVRGTASIDGFDLLPAALVGFGRSVASEHPDLWGGVIDLDPSSPVATAADALLARSGSEGLIIRAGHSWSPRLVPQGAAPGEPWAPDSQGCYLISGGLGGVGLHLAEWLANKGARSLLLLGRSEASQNALRAIERLRAGGTDIVVLQADVSDRAQLRKALALMPNGRSLRGVIHAAGVVDDGLLTEQTGQRLQSVLSPKVVGSWNLHCETLNQPLDLFLLCGSASALLGGPGQSSYAAANEFLAAFVQYRRAQGLCGTCIDWGPWEAIGMTAHLSLERARSWGVSPLTPERALRGLEQALASGAPRVAVLDVSWQRFARTPLADGARALLEQLMPKHFTLPPTNDPELGRRLAELEPRLRSEQVQAHLSALVAEVVKLPAGQALDPQRGLLELGLDSLMTLELKRKLESTLGLRLEATIVFNYPSIAKLGSELARRLTANAAAPSGDLGGDGSLLGQLLDNLDSLSDEEAARLASRVP
jgi:acyl transferase domain-containing protein/acyl-CoA synthetase (AMP-forming)/AMP-acid ligase II/acyl carrier protein